MRRLLDAQSLLAAAIVFGSLGAGLNADDKKTDAKKPDPKEIEKQFKEFATPGKEHKQFRRLVGRWNADVKTYHEGKLEESKGTSTFRLLLGGRYLQQNYKGEIAGQKFEGIGITGFDKSQNKYVGTWIDSMGTGMMHTEGSYDAKTNTMTEIGTATSPIGPMKFKMVSRFTDNDKLLFTMYMVMGDKENKIMEITYTRDKKAGKGKKRKKQAK